MFSDPTVKNVTVVDNINGIMADNADPNITDSIFWNNANGDMFNCTAQYSFVQDEIQANLISYWKLDGDATDSAGTNDGTIYGATPTTGQVGGAMYFDGVDDYISVPDNPSLDITGEITLTCWTKLLSRDTSELQMSFGKHGAYTIYAESHIDGGTGNWKGQITGSEGSLYGTTKLETGQWYHLAVTYDGQTIKVYLDGQLEGQKSFTSGIGTSNYNLSFGNEENTMSYFLHGMLDEIMLFDSALPAEKIEAMYQAESAGHEYAPLFADPDNGDYHLRSERGRYWPDHDVWILDEVTSPAIAAGAQAADNSNEPQPNGGRINMGAYGNTPYASMTELTGDLNDDRKIDILDLAVIAKTWLSSRE